MCPAHTDQYLSLIYLVKSLKERYYKKQSIHWQKIISLKEKCILIPKNNVPQALLSLIEQMSEAASSSKYGVVVMADLEGAFDAVWRDGAIYKLYQAVMKNNMLSVF